MVGADVFMGLSGPGLVTRDDVAAWVTSQLFLQWLTLTRNSARRDH